MGFENKAAQPSRPDLFKASLRRHAVGYGAAAAAAAVVSIGIAVSGAYGSSGSGGDFSPISSSPALLGEPTRIPPTGTDYEHPFSIFQKTDHGPIDPEGCFDLSKARRLPIEERGGSTLDIGDITATKHELDAFKEFHPGWEVTIFSDGLALLNSPIMSIAKARLITYGPGPGSLNTSEGGLVTAGGQSYLDEENDVTRFEIKGLIQCQSTLEPNILTTLPSNSSASNIHAP